ncbi:periplasmic heavy metal sensor [Brevundimonas sp. PAMC22021]|uniref:periplasmic heavy metal sensor n=1 Tax=Brevundimonas sp. PAMC22021 TaxID=2861285 RepID=UPI001C638966|nr:periplasmic heavy metal sensor [Brevundimonas sp. PAMC22021]QYF86163.1 periplasmic heavy metal sensor [Brevundimonas sp. PAMC22021]
MNARTLKIALAASVALNLFAVAGGVTAWIAQDRAVKHAEAQGRPGREDRLGTLLQPLPQPARERIRTELRASALTARPDFDAARAARRQAIERASAEPFNPAEVQALMEQARLAEMRGRARLESGAVTIMTGLSPAERRALAPILARRSDAKKPETPPPAPPQP